MLVAHQPLDLPSMPIFLQIRSHFIIFHHRERQLSAYSRWCLGRRQLPRNGGSHRKGARALGSLGRLGNRGRTRGALALRLGTGAWRAFEGLPATSRPSRRPFPRAKSLTAAKWRLGSSSKRLFAGSEEARAAKVGRSGGAKSRRHRAFCHSRPRPKAMSEHF